MLKKLVVGLSAAVLFLGAATLAAAGPKVAFKTNLGVFTVELDPEKAPQTVANFLAYVDSGFYNGVVFHRVKPRFMAQSGGFALQDGEYVQKPTRGEIRNEADNGLSNVRGAIAMARLSDPHSASAQFFINYVDNAFLDHRGTKDEEWGYAVFGRVVSGMNVVDQMAKVPTGSKIVTAKSRGGYARQPFKDVPRQDIVIISAQRVK